MAERSTADTRTRILDIAGELFKTQGYAGTSIADIARRLGTSKAALYYHFASKDDILDAILSDALSAHARIADLASTGGASAAQILDAFIDMVASAGDVLAVFGDDPSVASALAEHEEKYRLRQKNDKTVATLAGPSRDAAAIIRAHAAIAIAKDGTKAVMTNSEGRISDSARAELLSAALRALNPDREPSPPIPQRR